MKMTMAVYEKTKETINRAYTTADKVLLEKETQFLLDSFVTQIPDIFSNFVRFIGIREVKLKNAEMFLSQEHRENMNAVLEVLKAQNSLISDFAKVKLSFDKWFLEATDEGYIDYVYDSSVLVSAERAAEILSVTKPTVYKYLEKGLEYKEINGVKRIPEVAIELWKDPEYAFELQWIHQENKIRKQTLESKFEEVQKRIIAFEIEHGDTFEGLFGDWTEERIDGLDNAIDIYDWKELIDQKSRILSQIKNKKALNA